MWTHTALADLGTPTVTPAIAPVEWKLGVIDRDDVQGSSSSGGAAPTVSALRQLGGTVIGWRASLGEQPVFSFTPLRGSNRDCAPVGQVRVVVPGAAPALAWRGSPRHTWPDAGEVTVSLARWAGRNVELQLGAEGAVIKGHPCAFMWGSPALVMRTPAPPRTPHPRQPNILLIGADTLRADALGAWGRRPSVTPTLDALAGESDVWLDAFSAINNTNPSFSSIHTGLYVAHHGVHDLVTELPKNRVTLADRLKRVGYETRAILAAPHLAKATLQDRFDSSVVPKSVSSARLVVDDAVDWLQRPRPKPFFLWLHLFDAHTPHLPPAPYSLGERSGGVFGLAPVTSWVPFRKVGPLAFREKDLGGHFDLYAGEVAYLDRELDRLLGVLTERGFLADTIVVFVADHGENLEEHGTRYRHVGLFDSTTHVPLMIRWPGPSKPGRRIGGLVQSIDIAPTLLAAVGLAPPPMDGIDLRRLTAPGRHGRPAVFAEQGDGKGAAVRTADWRYFLSAGSQFFKDGPYLYDLRRDPGETTNLAGKHLPQEAELRHLLERWRIAGVSGRPTTLTAEEQAALHALGY